MQKTVYKYKYSKLFLGATFFAIIFSLPTKFSLGVSTGIYYLENETAKQGAYQNISIQNPDNPDEGFTMLDRNLGATATYDPNYPQQKEPFGYYYQWGSNHGHTINSETSQTLLEWDESYNNNGYDGPNKDYIRAIYYIKSKDEDISTLENNNYIESIQNYGDSQQIIFLNKSFLNAYNSNHNNRSHFSDYNDIWRGFINHHNLWGGESDNADNEWGYTGGVVANLTGRQGPCPEGYHVPNAGEWNKLLEYRLERYKIDNGEYPTTGEKQENLISSIEGVSSGFMNDLKIPAAGSWGEGGESDRGKACLWSSSTNNTDTYYSYCLLIESENMAYNKISFGGYPRGDGRSVRCFRDEYLAPGDESDNIYMINFAESPEGYGSVSKRAIFAKKGKNITINGNTISIGDEDTVTAIGSGNYVFSGWINDCGDEVGNGCTITGVFAAPSSRIITYDANGGHFQDNGETKEITFTRDNLNNKYRASETYIQIPHHNNEYVFEGWYTDKESYNEERSGIIDDSTPEEYTVYAKRHYVNNINNVGIFYETGINVTYTDPNNNYFEAGTITISDGKDTITMLDRNLGAKTINLKSHCSHGYYYQWGNNYGFSLTGWYLPYHGHSIKNDCEEYDVSDNPYANALSRIGNLDKDIVRLEPHPWNQGYGPYNTFTSNNFVVYNLTNDTNHTEEDPYYDDELKAVRGIADYQEIFNRHNENNPGNHYNVGEELNNIRGGGNDSSGNNYNNDNPKSERKGPCPTGYHIPSLGEFNKLVLLYANTKAIKNNIWFDDIINYNPKNSLNLHKIRFEPWDSEYSFEMFDDLLFPYYGGFIDQTLSNDIYNNHYTDENSPIHGVLRSSSMGSLDFYSNGLFKVSPESLRNIAPIRCFKDEPLDPSTYNEGGNSGGNNEGGNSGGNNEGGNSGGNNEGGNSGGNNEGGNSGGNNEGNGDQQLILITLHMITGGNVFKIENQSYTSGSTYTVYPTNKEGYTPTNNQIQGIITQNNTVVTFIYVPNSNGGNNEGENNGGGNNEGGNTSTTESTLSISQISLTTDSARISRHGFADNLDGFDYKLKLNGNITKIGNTSTSYIQFNNLSKGTYQFELDMLDRNGQTLKSVYTGFSITGSTSTNTENNDSTNNSNDIENFVQLSTKNKKPDKGDFINLTIQTDDEYTGKLTFRAQYRDSSSSSRKNISDLTSSAYFSDYSNERERGYYRMTTDDDGYINLKDLVAFNKVGYYRIYVKDIYDNEEPIQFNVIGDDDDDDDDDEDYRHTSNKDNSISIYISDENLYTNERIGIIVDTNKDYAGKIFFPKIEFYSSSRKDISSSSEYIGNASDEWKNGYYKMISKDYGFKEISNFIKLKKEGRYRIYVKNSDGKSDYVQFYVNKSDSSNNQNKTNEIEDMINKILNPTGDTTNTYSNEDPVEQNKKNISSESDEIYKSRSCKEYRIIYSSELGVFTSPDLQKTEFFINKEYFKRYIDSKNPQKSGCPTNIGRINSSYNDNSSSNTNFVAPNGKVYFITQKSGKYYSSNLTTDKEFSTIIELKYYIKSRNPLINM